MVLYGQLLTGRKYVPKANGVVELEKQWAKQVLPFAYQTVVKVHVLYVGIRPWWFPVSDKPSTHKPHVSVTPAVQHSRLKTLTTYKHITITSHLLRLLRTSRLITRL